MHKHVSELQNLAKSLTCCFLSQFSSDLQFPLHLSPIVSWSCPVLKRKKESWLN